MDPYPDPDADPDPAIFVIDLKVFLLISFWRYIYIIFKDKKSKSSRNQGFPYYLLFYYLTTYCLVTEGSGSGSIPLADGFGFGSRRPKNMWIRIGNTDFFEYNLLSVFRPHFYIDTNPRICTTGLRIRILLFSSVTFKKSQVLSPKFLFVYDWYGT